MRTRIALLVFFCASFLMAAVAPAQARGTFQSQPQITVTAKAGYGDTGAYLIGEWLPVRVTLTNPQGGQSMRVTVRVSSGANVYAPVYDREVDLPSPSRKEITLYTYDGTYNRVFTVKVLAGDREISSINVSAEPLEAPANMIVAVASSDTSLLNVLKGEGVGHIVERLPSSYGYYGPNPSSPTSGSGPATVAHITLGDIPPLSQALDSLGAIILDDVDTGTLSEEQRAALEAWVARGGTLVATYRPGGVDTLAGLGDLPPVTVSGSRDVSSLSPLADLIGLPITTTGSVAVGNAQLKAGPAYSSRVLATTADGTPLVVVRDLGLGQVVYLGLSPALPPLKGWEGTVRLVKRLLSEHDLRISYGASLRTSPEYSYMGMPGGGAVFEAYGGLFALPGLELPDPWLIGGFLLLYIIVIGPVNFIVLRRLRRAEMAWITIPVLVALFSIVAYALALGSKGASLISIRANVVHTVEGIEQASLAQHFGLYSPARRTYRLDLNTDSVLTEINAYGYYQGPTAIKPPVIGGNGTTSTGDVNIDTWSLRGFLAQHAARLQSPLEADLHLGQNEIVGRVTNRTNGPLEDVALVRGRAMQYIGYMAPGETVDARLDVSNGIFDNSTPANLLPPPAGVVVQQPGGYYYGPGSTSNNQPQRLYDRKVALLSAALHPFVSGEPPTDMSVIMLAWGPAPSIQFGVQGYSTASEDVNVWADLARVKADANGLDRLDFLRSASVPYSIYAPGNNPSLLPMGQAYSGMSAQSQMFFLSQPLPFPTATPIFPFQPGQPTPGASIRLAPYADLQFRMPAGTKPATLLLKYTVKVTDEDAVLDLLAYNIATGRWDTLSTLERDAPDSEISIPDPTRYTGSAGDMTLRVLSSAETNLDAVFDLALNPDP
jgi:hypothetical protein